MTRSGGPLGRADQAVISSMAFRTLSDGVVDIVDMGGLLRLQSDSNASRQGLGLQRGLGTPCHRRFSLMRAPRTSPDGGNQHDPDTEHPPHWLCRGRSSSTCQVVDASRADSS